MPLKWPLLSRITKASESVQWTVSSLSTGLILPLFLPLPQSIAPMAVNDL